MENNKAVATKIQAIWDRDHGPENAGWYARVHLSDGQERDIPFSGRESASAATVARNARHAAIEDGPVMGYAVPRGVPVAR